MKRLFGLLLGCMVVTSANATQPSYNFIHTAESNGYFQLELSIPHNAKPLPVEDVFVIHYPTKQQALYRPILRTIQTYGGTIITKEHFNDTAFHETMKRYIFLGKEYKEYPSFEYKKDYTLDIFEQFLQAELLPVYMKDVELLFGGNVHDVYPKTIPFLHEGNNFVLGQFKKTMKTRLELRANTSDGYIITNTLLDFSNPTFSTDDAVDYLGESWEEAKQFHDKNTREKVDSFVKWGNLFPIVLLVIGLGIILFGLIMFGRRLKEESLLPNDFWDDAPDTVIDEEEKEILIQPEDDDLPFEVFLKQKKKK